MPFQPGFMGKARPPLTLAFLDSTAVEDSTTISIPAVTQAGDLLVMIDAVQSDTPISAVVPSGWTQIATAGHGNVADGQPPRVVASARIATGAGGSATGMSGSGVAIASKAMAAFRPLRPITSINIASVNSQATTGNPSSQTVTSSGGTPPLVVVGFYAASAAIAPRTMSPAKHGEQNASNNAWLAWRIYDTSPANVSVDMDDEGTNTLISCYIEVIE